MKRLLLIACAVALAGAPSAVAARKPVPSLTPAATHSLWLKLVHRHLRLTSDASCRTARAVFYAPTDWLRLATKLAQQESPCAQYYVSVPPLAADKTQARANQAAQIRALGPNFHALDEVSYSGWSGWVAAGSGTWYDAGVTARQRMAAAGFDPAAGDTWALNELSSAVRTGAGNARRNALDFLHGLANDGTRGVVFAAGVGQSTSDLSHYKVNLQDWLQDGGFWNELAGYTTDFAQETYGDIRSYAVGGSSPQQRRDAMAQYLAHEPALANAGPGTVASARAFLAQSYTPFGNAAWAWSSAYGWTSAPLASMQDFVSGQVYADRSFAFASGAGVDRLGFAWAPSNTLGLSDSDFGSQTASLLDRLASAIRDSATPATDPGSGACAPSWCTTTVDGAAFAPAWQQFGSWSAAVPVFTNAPLSLAAGAAGGLVTVQLQTLGIADNAVVPRTIAFSSTSAAGAFSAAASGPWSPTLTTTIPPGSSTVPLYYSDTAGGSPTLTAQLDDGSAATQTEQVAAPAAPEPAASGGAAGTAPPPPPAPGPAPVTAPVTAPAAPSSAPPPPKPHVASVRTRVSQGHVLVTVAVAAGSHRAGGGVAVKIRVRRGARTIAVVTRVTSSNGIASWRSAGKLPRGRYVATAAAVR